MTDYIFFQLNLFSDLQEFSNDPPGSVTALMYKGTVLSCKPPLYNPGTPSLHFKATDTFYLRNIFKTRPNFFVMKMLFFFYRQDGKLKPTSEYQLI